MRNVRRVLRLSIGKRGVKQEVDEEIRFHLESRVADLIDEGMMPDEAERMAGAEFGDVERFRGQLTKLRWRRSARRQTEDFLSSVLEDARMALRGLRKRPAFGAVAILTLAVAIGGNTTIFSAADALLLRPLPFPESDRLVQISLVKPPSSGRPEEETSWSFLKFRAFMGAQRVLESAVIYFPRDYNLTHVRDPEQVRVEAVSADYFRLLGIPAGLGRTFLSEEDRVPGTAFVAVLSHRLWIRRYGGDPLIVGSTVHLNHQPYTVVGVAAPGFRGLSAGADLWVPTMTLEEPLLSGRSIHAFFAVGRLRRGTTVEQARSEMPLLAEVVTQVESRARRMDVRVRALAELRIGLRMRLAVVILFLAVVFVHLIACSNLANLLLARSAVRRKEMAIRTAVGAGRGRLVRQLLTESLVLALLGAGAGLILAAWGAALLQRMGPSTQSFVALPDLAGQTQLGLTNIGFQGVGLDGRTLAFGLCLTLLTALLFGLGPAMRASCTDLDTALNAGRWQGEQHARRARFRLPGPQSLVAVQVALAFVLLVGAGLLIRSLVSLLATDLGYMGEHVVSAKVQLPRDQYGDYSSYGSVRSARFLKELVERARGSAVVEAAGLATCLPLSASCSSNRALFPDRPPDERGTEPRILVNIVEGDYFGTLGIPLYRGRLFSTGDNDESPRVVVVNRAAAEQFWPGDDPIGKPIEIGGWFGPNTVVGVVADVHYGSIEAPPEPMLYVPLAQLSAMGGNLVVRGRSDPSVLVGLLRAHVREMDPDLPLAEVKTMSEWYADASFIPRFGAVLLGLFAAVAVLLSTMGVYGVLSGVVAVRRREVGVRMALGARREDVLKTVIRHSASLVVPGMVVGFVLALFFTRLLEALLVGVRPRDPAAFLGGTLVLALTGAAASLVPALRATRVNPVEALKAE